MLKTNATGTTTISIPFYNAGTVKAAQGIIGLANGGVLGGTFVASSGAAVDFDGELSRSPAPFRPAVEQGRCNLPAGATVTFSRPITNFSMAGGTLSGNNVVTGMLDWTGESSSGR